MRCDRCDGDGRLLKCPACGHVNGIRNFDAGGADPGNLFCNQCHHEAEMDDLPCPECASTGEAINPDFVFQVP